MKIKTLVEALELFYLRPNIEIIESENKQDIYHYVSEHTNAEAGTKYRNKILAIQTRDTLTNLAIEHGYIQIGQAGNITKLMSSRTNWEWVSLSKGWGQAKKTVEALERIRQDDNMLA